MRICCVGFAFNWPTAGRVLNFFSYLSDKYNIKIDIITVKDWNGYVFPELKKYNKKNLRIHLLKSIHLDHGKTQSQHRFLFPGLYKKLKQLKPDIVFGLSEPISLVNFQLTLISKLLGLKVGLHCWENLTFKHFFLIRWMEKYSLKNCDFLVAGTEEVKGVYIKRGVPAKKISVFMEAGIDTNFYRPIKNPSKIKRKFKQLANLPKDKTIIFIGRIMEVKGIKPLLKAAEILDKKKTKYKLLLVGFGKQNEKKLVEKVKNFSKEHKNVILLEDLESKYIPEAYNLGSVFVYPSIPSKQWREQFGYSVIEAMSCYIPVISTYSGGPSTSIKDGKNGFLVQPDNAEALAEKIKILLKNTKLKRRMGIYARKYVINKYSIPAISKKFYNKFNEVLR